MSTVLPTGWLLPARLLLLLSCLVPHLSRAQTAPTFDMAVRVLAPGASTRPFSQDVAVDAAGNSYISGQFSGSTRFGTTTILGSNAGNVYIAKIDAAGSYRWIISIRTSGGNYYGLNGSNATSLAIDATGNVYVAGSFTEATLTLGNTTLTNAGGSDLFVGKLDTNGNWLSAVRGGGAGSEVVLGMTLDGSGNAYLSGQFTGSAAFGNTTLTTTGAEDLFAARLDANGTWRWAAGGGSSSSDIATDVALDASGHVYIAGMLSAAGGRLGSFALPRAMAVARLDAGTGTYQQVTPVPVAMLSGIASGTIYPHLAVDAAGGCYLAGNYLGSLTFGAYTINSNGTTVSLDDVFVAKLDAAGTWQWASNAGGAYGAYCSGIAVDDRGGVYIGGSFRGPTQFGTTALVSQNLVLAGNDSYVAKLNAAGTWLWAVPGGGPQDDRSTGFTLGPCATPYIVGEHFSPSMAFGTITVPGEPVFAGSTFVARLQPNQLRIAGDSTLCNGGSTQLTASTLGTRMSWRWNTGATGSTLTVTQPGTYTVTATFPNGYSLSESYRVRSIPSPSATVTGGADVLCPGTPRQLTAVAAGAVGWVWSTGATTQSITITQPGTYSVTATFGSSCIARAQTVVAGNELGISGRLQLCPGQSTTLTATTAGTPATGYLWNTGATTPTLLVGQAGTFQVTATFADGCQLSTTHTVGPPMAEVASVSGDTILCPDATLALTALNPDALTYRWNTGATTPTIAVTQPGTYGVLLTYTGGCTSRDSLRVLPAPVIPAALTLGRDTIVCEEEPLLLRAPTVAGPGVVRRWSDGSDGPTLTARKAGNYSLQIRTPCESVTLRRSVSYTSCLLIPNVITPNGDRQNDQFVVQNMTGGDWGLTLYNRWGRQVYHTDAYHQEWGRDAPAGVYYYILHRPIVNVRYKGWVEVIR